MFRGRWFLRTGEIFKSVVGRSIQEQGKPTDPGISKRCLWLCAAEDILARLDYDSTPVAGLFIELWTRQGAGSALGSSPSAHNFGW